MAKTELKKSIEAYLSANTCKKASCTKECAMCIDYATKFVSYEIQRTKDRKKQFSEALERRRNHPDNNPQ